MASSVTPSAALCGLPGNGSRAQTHFGHMIETQVDLA
jgi:hypothetical protein